MPKIINIEIKARMEDPSGMRQYLQAQGALFKGVDHQIDTYFNASHGRLKLRQGNIECSLIAYHRPNQNGPKQSDVMLQRLNPEMADGIKLALTQAIGVKVVVDKRREIYFIDHVKFHIDTVEGLGHFAEIEAIDSDGTHTAEQLHAHCEAHINGIGIEAGQLLTHSYSDMLLQQ